MPVGPLKTGNIKTAKKQGSKLSVLAHVVNNVYSNFQSHRWNRLYDIDYRFLLAMPCEVVIMVS